MGYLKRTEFNSYNEFMNYLVELSEDSECILIQFDDGEKEIILFDAKTKMHKVIFDNYSTVNYHLESNDFISFKKYPKEFYKSIDFIYCL